MASKQRLTRDHYSNASSYITSGQISHVKGPIGVIATLSRRRNKCKS